jgi:hypothetical protein
MKYTIFFLLSIFVTGCSLEASISSLVGGSPAVQLEGVKTSGLVSGSTQTGIASGSGGASYNVHGTVGSYMSGIDARTSDGSYTIYGSVQGAIVSGSQ